jgi:glyoxylase-like metal-dependent hydrolase (beta-lactamase superfamily II)
MTDLSENFSRRSFIAQTSRLASFCAVAQFFPLAAIAKTLASDSRVSQPPLVDKGFASVHKVGTGLYATISDPTKGYTTLCNGGFFVGKQNALLLEGFGSAAGAAFQMDALRMVSQVPVHAAMDTHYHYDHSMGNSFYGANGIPLWAHASVSKRIAETYGGMQSHDQQTVLASLSRRVENAKSDIARERAQGDLNAMTGVYRTVSAGVLALPNRPIDPASLPMKIDLGGLVAVIEFRPGHSGTDLIVKVPEQNVVFTGDLLFSGWYPVCFDEQATVSGWRDTLKQFSMLDKDTIFVPGHGQICGQEGIALFRAIFDDIAEQAEKLYKAGVPVEEAEQRYVVPERYKNVPIFAWGLTVAPAIRKLYGEWQFN